MQKVLIADDHVSTCLLLSKLLQRTGYETETALSGKSALEGLNRFKADLCICDYRLGDIDGMDMIEKLKTNYPAMPVIMITGYSDTRLAVSAIKAGAFDYITKPIITDEILNSVKRAFSAIGITPVQQKVHAVPPSAAAADADKKDTGYIQGNSIHSKQLHRDIDLIAPTDYSIIIYGESGSGKEAVARMIHEKSARAGKPFVAMDCGAIPKDISAGELFGYEKGAFTGAVNAKPGHFEMANGGTLFLDEVANLPYNVQVSLLRVVQERMCRRLGGTKDIHLDMRILVASNENLQEAYRAGRFREDLYHRFNEFSVHIHPLRERKADILPLAQHFLQIANAEQGKEVKRLTPRAERMLRNYWWPGNIRELKNVIRRAVLVCHGDVLDSVALPQEMMQQQNQIVVKLKDFIHLAEIDKIKKTLSEVGNNKSKAAKALEIDRKTLYNKMKQLKIN
jgi:two-component system, NtrC family, response regulator HydG